jgi:hypothetical protein
VTDVNSKRPLTGAQVRIAGAALVGLTDDRGVFNISGAPGGTQTLLIRAVGYAPEQRTIELVADGSLSVDISLTNLRSLLDTIRVTASRVYSRDGNGFERRRKIGSGHYFDSTDVEHYRPSEITGLLEMVGGVRVAGAGLNQRIIMQHIDACEPTIFVDGMAFADFTAADLNMMVPPEDVIGVEVYTSAATAPVQFKGMQSLSRGAEAVDRLSSGPKGRGDSIHVHSCNSCTELFPPTSGRTEASFNICDTNVTNADESNLSRPRKAASASASESL